MRFLTLFVLLVLAPLSSQDLHQFQNCDQQAKTQADLNACANDQAVRADAQLDRVYSKLLAVAAKENGAAEKVRAVRQAWTAYRDAYMEAMYPAANKQAEYGSIFPMKADLLRAELTEREVKAANELLRQYTGER
jgi:uncharacterized protein YecT (DUF1311 family)